MTLQEAIKIIDIDIYDKNITEEELIEAQIVFWRDLFGVSITNPDGSYKSMNTIFEVASKHFSKSNKNFVR